MGRLGFFEIILIMDFVLCALLLLGFSYFIWSVASKEQAKARGTGLVISYSIMAVTFVMFVYAALYGGDVLKRGRKALKGFYRISEYNRPCAGTRAKPEAVIIVPKGTEIRTEGVKKPVPAAKPAAKCVTPKKSIAPIPEFKKRYVKQMLNDPQMRQLIKEQLKKGK